MRNTTGGFVFILAVIVGLIFASSGSVITTKQVHADDLISSVASGNWSDLSIWDGEEVPEEGDFVNIASGHTVTYDVLSDEVLGEITIDGTLKFSRQVNTRLKTNDNIIVRGGGVLDMGTAEDYIPATVNAEVIWVLTQEQADAFVGGPPAGAFEPADFQETDKGLWAFPGSRWDVHGAPLLHTWAKLSKDARAGDLTVEVEGDVTDWYVGGTVVFSSTSLPVTFIISGEREDPLYVEEDELLTINP